MDRIVLAILFEGLCEEELGEGDSRIVFKVKPSLAPIKVNILPLIKKRHAEEAKKLYKELRRHFMVQYDESGSIGKRYRRGDAVGVPFAVTIDDNTLENGTVTVRERDSMEQKEIALTDLVHYLHHNL